MLPFLGGREYWQWVMTYCRNSGDRIQPSRCHPLRSRQWWWPCLFLWFPIGRRSFSPTARLFLDLRNYSSAAEFFVFFFSSGVWVWVAVAAALPFVWINRPLGHPTDECPSQLKRDWNNKHIFIYTGDGRHGPLFILFFFLFFDYITSLLTF